MKKLISHFTFACLLAFGPQGLFAQVSLYDENFDASLNLPSGWYATPGSWVIDSAAANASTGYPGASSHNNVVIRNAPRIQDTDSLITRSIATTGYTSITVEWGTRNTTHFSDSGSHIQGFYWSADGGAIWNNISYAENGNNSAWSIDNGGTAIALPADAANQAAIMLMWVAQLFPNPSGTYRIDDLNVSGTPIAGINEVHDDAVFARTYVSRDHILISQSSNEPAQVEIFDPTGQRVHSSVMNAAASIATEGFSPGIYFVRVSNASLTASSKIVLK